MAALIKYADSDNTKDPGSNDEKSSKGKKNGNGKGQQQNTMGHNGNHQASGGKRRCPDGGSDFVANTNAGFKGQRRNDKGKLAFGGKNFNLEAMLNEPCPKHSLLEQLVTHG
mgnify:CR=1 FL=1